MTIGADARAFFDRTIAKWRCDRCATEFTVRYVWSSEAHRSLGCPLCDASEEDLTRLGDTEPAEVSA
jgi:Zn finger protein HypA/HybF involved in hydrogenase expression